MSKPGGFMLLEVLPLMALCASLLAVLLNLQHAAVAHCAAAKQRLRSRAAQTEDAALLHTACLTEILAGKRILRCKALGGMQRWTFIEG